MFLDDIVKFDVLGLLSTFQGLYCRNSERKVMMRNPHLQGHPKIQISS